MEHISKISVAPGIFWVEIPQADFRLLCGSPADAVKHLMLRGLVVPTQKNGVACETGPNAILLSDLTLQAGAFCNMAEFPVLQMLYRQGMLLPGHPNNTGAKPLLIGHADQIEAQQSYIYRGNYGLVSKDELMLAGLSQSDAEAMMRLKLKFAFGEIKDSSAFLDCRAVHNEATEVVPGVTVRRLGMNKYEIAFKGEAVTVDLNLKPGQRYQSPYPLNYHMIDRGYFDVIHSGDGDGWDVRRPSMASVLVFQGRVYLIDAGPNIEGSLRALGIGINEVEGIFHTHSHDDHFAGITTLIRAGRRIKYFATPLVRASVSKKLSALLAIDETAFGDFFDVVDLPLDKWSHVGGLEVKPLFSPHPVETTIFQFRALGPDGMKTYAHYADIAAFKVLEGMVTDKADAPGISRELFDQTKAVYLEEATVKKIDAGGGMIHGEPEDFRDDPSDKIILSHRATAFSPSEIEIGSGAPFGTKEVLIPSFQNFLWRAAYRHLQNYFPTVDPDRLRALANNAILELNPEEIILKQGEEVKTLYLLLTGTVDALNDAKGRKRRLSAGVIIGDNALLRKSPSLDTYRTSSFVRALAIRADQFRSFIRANGLFESLANAKTMQSFLEDFPLLDAEIPQETYMDLTRDLDSMIIKAGETVTMNRNDQVMLVSSGKLERRFGGKVVEILNPGDFFGEEVAVFKRPSIFTVRAVEKTEICLLPSDTLSAVPVLRWTFLEAMERRHGLILDIDQRGLPVIKWRDDYSISIDDMDLEHKKLFMLADRVLAAIRLKNQNLAERSMADLIDYAKIHFSDEEQLLTKYSYPELSQHKALHIILIKSAERVQRSFSDPAALSEERFQEFFGDWLVRHILAEDKRYAAFIAERTAIAQMGGI